MKRHWIRFSAIVTVLACFSVPTVLRAGKPTLPQDQGFVALEQELQRLRTTARIMQTTAHPDDEDGGMLTLESRGRGATVLLLTLTRGQGGQNKSGDAFSDQLGVLRTLELLAADEYYGVEQRFTRLADFGFSKTPEETFEKWGGHEPGLADMVRVIRTFRPDVLVARFQGTTRDGHAHHQASAVLTREAFRAAGDPKRFPEQIHEGLLPWQPKKLYLGNMRDADNPNLKLDIGQYSPLLGVSYTQFAVEGLAHQTSQGTGGFRLPPGHRITNYKRIDSVLPAVELKGEESDFEDGIDTSLPGLASRIGNEQEKIPQLRSLLQRIAATVDQAAAAVQPRDPSPAGAPLLEGLGLTNQLIDAVRNSQLSAAAKLELLTHLETKQQQFTRAANLALGVLLEASVDPPDVPQTGFFRLEQTQQSAVPGQSLTVTARLYDRGNVAVDPSDVALDLPEGFKAEVLKRDLKTLHAGDVASVQFRVSVPADAPYTMPYWGRKNAYKETLDTFSVPQYATRALPPWPFHARATYKTGQASGSADAVVMAKYVDPVTGQGQHELPVVPALSVEFANVSEARRAGSSDSFPVTVKVRSQLETPAEAVVRLDLPAGWSSDPASRKVHIDQEGETVETQFSVKARSESQGREEITAGATYNGVQYKQGFDVVSRADLDTFYYYHPAILDVNSVDVKIPSGLKIGYVMGAGDEIAATLRQLGMDIEPIAPADLATADLSRFHTIVLGIRAYDVSNAVRAANSRLLAFVSAGGTLIVQYNSSISSFNAGHYTPYLSTIANQRVSVEEAPVTIVDPQSPVLSQPNKITQSDFEGWVQERGLYFMGQWDDHFHPVLESHDPGEAPLSGGLLVAQYGKGTYIYSGYAFFRQLPAGVPGAIRLFVNLLSAGR